ncbi:MAG: hypothetical protein QOD67_2906, partial [Caballeronia sp.]|nr:hypothetical protein [Caballeronia sp.]
MKKRSRLTRSGAHKNNKTLYNGLPACSGLQETR